MTIHLTGSVFSAGGARPEAWVVDGRMAWSVTAAPVGAAVTELSGVVLPGLVDVHCHVGLGAHGAVTREDAESQALADRDAGVLLIRDAGSPSDTRWIDDRVDLPRIIRAGRHLARPKRYLPGFAEELDDVAGLPEAMARNARAGDGWVKLVADWIDRSEGAES
ncbi:MAG: amidohydrolase family protein, partial [Actinomycetota bacterium]